MIAKRPLAIFRLPISTGNWCSSFRIRLRKGDRLINHDYIGTALVVIPPFVFSQEWYQTGANEIPEGATLESLYGQVSGMKCRYGALFLEITLGIGDVFR
jgi:hypothetical protein